MKRRNHREEGAALVAVLCLIVTAGVLVGSLVSISRISAIHASGITDAMRANYVAEGAAARIRFLIEADRAQFSERSPENVDFDEYEHDRYLADGAVHTLDYYGKEIKFTIHDGVSGIPFASGSGLEELSQNRTDESLVTDAVELYQHRVADYMDSDDTVNEDSYETEEYDALNRKNMPRNAAPYYREELLWIPGIAELLPVDRDGRFSIIRHFLLPTGTAWSIYSVPYAVLRTQGGMTAEQAAKTLQAVRLWQIERTPIADTLDEVTLNLAQKFSWTESGYYTVRIFQTDADHRPGGRLLFTFQSDGVGGPSSKVATFIEYFRF